MDQILKFIGDWFKRPIDLVVGLLIIGGFVVFAAATFTISTSVPYVLGVNNFRNSWPGISLGLILMLVPVIVHAIRKPRTANVSSAAALRERKERTGFRTREDEQYKIEAHVAGLCFRCINGEVQLLVGHRTQNRKLYPNLWECGGGQVHTEENFRDALHRQHFEEFGIQSKILQPFTTYEIIRPDGPKIPGIVFFCVSIENGKENIQLNEAELCEYRWITEEQCRDFNMIPGMQNEAQEAFVLARQHYKTNS